MRSFAGAYEDAAEAGQVVDPRILRAVANVKAAVAMAHGLHPGSTRAGIDTGRLHRQLMSLRDDLEATRLLLQRVTERLGREADRARQAGPGPGRDRADIAVARFSGVRCRPLTPKAGMSARSSSARRG